MPVTPAVNWQFGPYIPDEWLEEGEGEGEEEEEEGGRRGEGREGRGEVRVEERRRGGKRYLDTRS